MTYLQAPAVSFVIVSICWGLTWIAIKIGVENAPPLFFAATRFTIAGLLLGLIFRRRIQWRGLGAHAGKVALVSLLMTTFCYGPLFWGIQHTPSGLAAVINQSLIPIGLLLFGGLIRVEAFSLQKFIGVGLGVMGLAILFAPGLHEDRHATALGIGAIIAGTLSACLGTVLVRRWLNEINSVSLGAAITFIGGLGLGALSALSEPISKATIFSLFHPQAIAGLLFLIVCGSIVAFTLYLRLLTLWGPLRAGLYAFVSPVVALFAGYLVLEESLNIRQLTGVFVLILASLIVTTPRGLRTRSGTRRRSHRPYLTD